jgi:hypothetical protein
MRDFTWSATQKKAARAAFDLALAREFKAIRQEAEAMLRNSTDDRIIWRLHDYLDMKRREIEREVRLPLLCLDVGLCSARVGRLA